MRSAIVLAIGALALSGCVTAPPILKGVSNTKIRIPDEAFNRKVAQTFPAGTPGSAVTAALTKQGFKPDGWAGPRREMSLSYRYFVASCAAHIAWTSGPDGRITGTEASHMCLATP